MARMFGLHKKSLSRKVNCENCGSKFYYYKHGDLKVGLCYKCGKFECKTYNAESDELFYLLSENPDVLLNMIETGFLEPI
jgi:ribosomal protein S27E